MKWTSASAYRGTLRVGYAKPVVRFRLALRAEDLRVFPIPLGVINSKARTTMENQNYELAPSQTRFREDHR